MAIEKAQFSSYRKLTRSQVQCLAFEGGGGKGFAYIGAIRALEELGIVQTSHGDKPSHSWIPDYLEGIDASRRLRPELIHGISGSSAGAITAMLLSCGYSSHDVQQIMTRFDFNGLFEPPTPRYVPKIQLNPSSDDALGAIEKSAELPDTSATLEALVNYNLTRLASLSDPLFAAFGLAHFRPGEQHIALPELRSVLDLIMTHVPLEQRDQVRSAMAEATIASTLRMLLLLPYTSGFMKKTPKAVEQIAQFATHYSAFLPEDLGFFAGYEARRFFADALAYKLPLRNGRPWYNATFLDHYQHFGIELAITGTNFETKKGGVFSWKTAPNFPVADAVRLSMSMPLIFKPVVIRPGDYPDGYLPNWVNGVWVDGGYLNNIPLHVFDTEEGSNPKTLGLRLSISDEQPIRIENIMDFLTRWANFGVWGAGEAQINEPNMNVPQTILFDTTGLSSIDFDPAASDRDRAIEKAYRDTLDYFDE